MSRVVSLTVHKNTATRHESKRLARKIVDAAHGAQRGLNGEMAGYAFVAWDRDHTHYVSWAGSKHLGQYPLPDFVRMVLERSATADQAKDEILGPPPDKGA